MHHANLITSSPGTLLVAQVVSLPLLPSHPVSRPRRSRARSSPSSRTEGPSLPSRLVAPRIAPCVVSFVAPLGAPLDALRRTPRSLYSPLPASFVVETEPPVVCSSLHSPHIPSKTTARSDAYTPSKCVIPANSTHPSNPLATGRPKRTRRSSTASGLVTRGAPSRRPLQAAR